LGAFFDRHLSSGDAEVSAELIEAALGPSG